MEKRPTLASEDSDKKGLAERLRSLSPQNISLNTQRLIGNTLALSAAMAALIVNYNMLFGEAAKFTAKGSPDTDASVMCAGQSEEKDNIEPPLAPYSDRESCEEIVSALNEGASNKE